MPRKYPKLLAFLSIVCLSLAACESADFDDPKPRQNVYGGRGAGAGGG